MPRQKQVEISNTFARGLITEVSSLNFPKDACIETDNCKFDYKGIVTRRLGFDYETGFSSFESQRSDDAVSEFVWEAPNGNGARTYVVVQIGATLYFYEEDIDGPLSPGKESFTILLTDFDITGAPTVDTEPCQYAAGKGFLFVAHPYCEPFYVTLSAAADAVSGTAITVKTRDLVGLTPTATYPDNVTRPTSTQAGLDDFDEYNLFNAGWDRGPITDHGGDSSNSPIEEWDSQLTTMPALSDIWWTFQFNTDPRFYDYRESSVTAVPASSTRAPMGFYILNEFLQERDVVSGISGLSDDDVTSSYFRPKTIAFFAGRVWYAGVDFTGYNNKVYFSQIIERDAQFGMCFQNNDPTSEEFADLLSSDGGTIKILDAANVVKLFVMGPTMLVFATNGIWAISGSQTDGLGFAANDYTIRKISSVGALTGSSFVDVEGTPVWWNFEGIWTLASTPEGLQVQSLTKETIQTVFDQIPLLMKLYTKGAYNRSLRIVQWLYRDTTTTDVDERYNYNKVLSLNVQTRAFYPWTIDTTVGALVNGIVSCRGVQDQQAEDTVVDGGVTVTDSSGETVTALVSSQTVAGSAFHYLTTKLVSGTTFTTTFSKEHDGNYEDWETAGTGVSYDSSFVTGYYVGGQAQRFFQSNYVFVYLQTMQDASCNFQSIWDYASSASGGRFGNPQEVYRDRPFTEIQQSRVKARGKGRANQFKFYSTANRPFSIHGWSTWVTQTVDP